MYQVSKVGLEQRLAGDRLHVLLHSCTVKYRPSEIFHKSILPRASFLA